MTLKFTQGNLLESGAEAIVNTVNTVGVMGKGIALMFKDSFPDNFKAYELACKRKQLQVGKIFATPNVSLIGPRWIINFPTKKHWKNPSKIEWVREGLIDLKRFIIAHDLRSIAIPPLGSGNGGLDWQLVRLEIIAALGDLPSTEIIVYEPSATYRNVAKSKGVEKLTPARALIAELVRQYEVIGLGCTILEVQKLAYFLQRAIDRLDLANPLKLEFKANKFGPYAPRLGHLLNSLDGSYLHCSKRLADASPFDLIEFDESRKADLEGYLKSDSVGDYVEPLNTTSRLIDGFQSPLGMELLATIDWIRQDEPTTGSVSEVRDALTYWPGGANAAERKQRLFDDKSIELALDRLREFA